MREMTKTALVAMLLVLPLAAASVTEGSESEVVGEGLRMSGQDREVSVLQVGPLVQRYRRVALPMLGRILLSERVAGEPVRWRLERLSSGRGEDLWASTQLTQEGREPTQIDGLVELLRTLVGGEVMERDGSWINAMDERLMLVFDKATVAQMRSATADMQRILAPRVRVHYLLYEGDPGYAKTRDGKGGDLEAQLQELQKTGAFRVLHYSTGTGRVGDQIQLGEFERHSFVGDANVEVAQEAAIADPQTQTVDLGHGLGCVVWQMPGSKDFSIFGVWTKRDLHDGFRRHDMQADKLRSLELTRIDQSQRLFSLRASAGSFQHVATFDERGRQVHAVLHLELLDERPERLLGAQQQVMEFVPLQLLTSVALRGNRDRNRGGFGRSFGGPVMPTDLLVDSIRNLLGDAADEGLSLWATGAQLAVHGKPELVQRAREIAAFYAQPYRRSFVVRIGREVRASEDPAATWQSSGKTLDIACLGGRFGYGMQGYEQTSIVDYSVEIAQESTMSDPIVDSFFAGVQAFASCRPMGAKVLVDVEMLDRVLIDIRSVQSTTDKGGAIELPVLREAVLEESLSMEPGQKLVVGAGPSRSIHGVPHRTRFTVELIER